MVAEYTQPVDTAPVADHGAALDSTSIATRVPVIGEVAP